jgi:hypothetical protein
MTQAWALLSKVVERIFTFAYHESLQRNTIGPLNKIIAAEDDDTRGRLLWEWSEVKAEESKYIQIAVRADMTMPLTLTMLT